jgi:hypothetical protein
MPVSDMDLVRAVSFYVLLFTGLSAIQLGRIFEQLHNNLGSLVVSLRGRFDGVLGMNSPIFHAQVPQRRTFRNSGTTLGSHGSYRVFSHSHLAKTQLIRYPPADLGPLGRHRRSRCWW